MCADKKQSDIVQRLKKAAAENEALKDELKQADDQSYDRISKEFSANYQLILDEAGKEISDEYKSTGSLTSARICEINRGMDEYALTVNDIMMLLKEHPDEE